MSARLWNNLRLKF